MNNAALIKGLAQIGLFLLILYIIFNTLMKKL